MKIRNAGNVQLTASGASSEWLILTHWCLVTDAMYSTGGKIAVINLEMKILS